MKAPMNYYRKPQSNSQSKTIAIIAALAFHALIIGAITMGTFKGKPAAADVASAQLSETGENHTMSAMKKRIEAKKAAMQQNP